MVLLNDIFLNILIGGNFNYGRDPGWRIPMRPIFNHQSTSMTENGTTTMTANGTTTMSANGTTTMTPNANFTNTPGKL